MASQARDKFVKYYTEKIWEWIPAIYREEDGLADNRDVLRSIAELLADKAAVLRRSDDKLWDDEFIDLCDDWAVPYIGQLVATRLVSALNKRGRRVDVAKTIYYRRRKGTPRILEELVSDITGWEGKLVEMFRRLSRARHGLDPSLDRLPLSFGPSPGGFADLRSARIAELAGGPFDHFSHIPDVRKQRGTDGLYNIPKLGLYLYRLAANLIDGADPAPGPTPTAFLADPSGRDVPLFAPRTRSEDWELWVSAREWQVPAPISCRLLNNAEFIIEEALILTLIATLALPAAAANDLRRIRSIRFESEQRLQDTIATMTTAAAILAAPVWRALIAGALVSDCGKFNLLPNAFNVESAPGSDVAREFLVAGNLSTFTAAAPGKEAVVDPDTGRILFLNAAPAPGSIVRYWYGFPGEIGAGTYDRAESVIVPAGVTTAGGGAIPAPQLLANGVAQIDDSRTYTSIANIGGITGAIVQAVNQQRPYIRLAADWVLDTGANVESTLLLEGLWIGADGAFAIVLQGDYETVTIRHCTLDPGGTDAQGNPIQPVDIVVRGNVEELVIERSIAARTRIDGAGLIDHITIRDSILQDTGGGPVFALPATRLHLERTTVFGGADVDLMYGTETLFTGAVDVTNTQEGCFRFSAAPKGSRVPHPYESHFITDTPHFFTSRRFGHPGYAQLSESVPPELARGAENESQIGAWSSLINPIKLDGLRAKVDEFAPFGLIPAFIFET